MGPQVTLQEPGPGESFPTELTLVVEVVGEDVHAERRHADVHLVADLALFSIVGVQAPVGLSVPGEVAAGGVVFAAVSTAVLGSLTLLPALLTPTVRNGQSGPLPGLPGLPPGRLLQVEGGAGGRGVPRVGDGRGERHMVTYLAGGDGGAGGGGAWRGTDIDEGGVLVLSVGGGRGGRSTVRARTAHHGGSWTGQGWQGARQLQQVVGCLSLLLGSVELLGPASIWGEISNF